MSSDPSLLKKLNAGAASGELRAFEINKPGDAATPVGRYDVSTKTVTLPQSALASESRADVVAIGRVQAMTLAFAYATYKERGVEKSVTTEMVANLQSVLNESPNLSAELKRAATTPDPLKPSEMLLERFQPIGSEFKVGGAYAIDGHEIQIPAPYLQAKTAGSAQFFNAADMTFVLGHEVRHAFNNERTVIEKAAFVREARAVASVGGPTHDYTSAIGSYQEIARKDEASAQLAGWNALVSRQKEIDPSVDLRGMLYGSQTGRVRDFLVDDNVSVAPRPGISFNDDLTIASTRENVAALGTHYFDRPSKIHPDGHARPVELGNSGVADYRNYYGAQAVSEILSIDGGSRSFHGEKPHLTIDMQKLGLHEDLLEREGISTGLLHARRPYYDSSQDVALPQYFDHTTSGKDKNAYVPSTPTDVPPRVCDIGHPDNELYGHVQSLVHELDRQHGRTPDERSDRLASSLVVAARAGGLSRVDEIGLSPDASKVWAVETKPGDIDHFFDKITSVPTVHALNTSHELSAAKWPQAMEQYNVTQQSEAMAREQAQMQQQSQGMSMSR
jgi:hypothetical protein